MADQNEPGTVQMGEISGRDMRKEGAPETQNPRVEEVMPKAMTTEERVANCKKNIFPRCQYGTRLNIIEDEVIELVVTALEDHPMDLDWLGQFHHGWFDHGFYVKAFDIIGGGTPLHWAVRMEDTEMVERILATKIGDVYARDKCWEAIALHWAVRLGNMPIVEVLLPKCDKDTTGKALDKWKFNAGEHALLSGITTNIPMLRKLMLVCNISSSTVQEEIDRILGANLDAEAQSRIDLLRENWYHELGHTKFRNSLHWAVTMDDVGMVAHILEAGKVDVNSYNDSGFTAFHLAVMHRNVDIVQTMITTKQSNLEKLDVNCTDRPFRYTALHWAVLSGEGENIAMVRELLKAEGAVLSGERENIAMVRELLKAEGAVLSGERENIAMVRELLKAEGIRLFEEGYNGVTPLQIAHERDFRDIQKALMEKEPVRRYVDDLYRDCQVYVDAANAILVGAALIASVTFASWLQPPMGYIDPGYAKVQHNRGLQAFWVFNSLSFYFAIATVVFGARSVLPRGAHFIKRTVEKLRKNLLATAVLLACSVFCVIIAFGIAGSIVLIPIVEFQLYMIVPTVFGGLMCVISLALLCKSMWEDSLGKVAGANRKYDWSDDVDLSFMDWFWLEFLSSAKKLFGRWKYICE